VIKSLLRMWLLTDTPDASYFCKWGVFMPEMFFGQDKGGPFITTAHPAHFDADGDWVGAEPFKVYPCGERKAEAA